MNLVDKEYVAGVHVGEERNQITDFFNGGAGGDADRFAHLIGDDTRECRFTEAGGTVEQDVIEGGTAHFSGFNIDFQIFLRFILPNIFVQSFRAEADFLTVFVRVIFVGHDPIFKIKFGFHRISLQKFAERLRNEVVQRQFFGVQSGQRVHRGSAVITKGHQRFDCVTEFPAGYGRSTGG